MRSNRRDDETTQLVANLRKSRDDDIVALRTFCYTSIGLMTVLVPMWVTIVVALGHGLLVAKTPASMLLHLFVGLAAVIAVVPLMLVAQQGITALVRATPINRRQGMVSTRLAVLLMSYYLAAVVFGLLAAGSPRRPLSADPAVVLAGTIAIGLLLASLVVALIEAAPAVKRTHPRDRGFTLRRLGYYSLIPMTLLAPAWVVDGRELFGVGAGVGGQVGFVLAVTIAPVMFAGQQLLVLVASKNPESRRRHAVSRRLAMALAVYYASALVLGLSVVDTGASVLTRLLGPGFAAPSSVMAGGAAAVAIVSLVCCVVVAGSGWRRLHHWQ